MLLGRIRRKRALQACVASRGHAADLRRTSKQSRMSDVMNALFDVGDEKNDKVEKGYTNGTVAQIHTDGTDAQAHTDGTDARTQTQNNTHARKKKKSTPSHIKDIHHAETDSPTQTNVTHNKQRKKKKHAYQHLSKQNTNQ